MIDRIDEEQHFVRNRRSEMGKKRGQMRAAELKEILFSKKKEGYSRIVEEMNA